MKINIKRLDHVQVCVPRGAEGEAREFYGGLLGLEEIEKPEVLRAGGGMWYEVADVQLHIGVEDTVAPSKRHPAFEVEDIGGVRDYLEQNGVRTKDEPSIPGARRFSFYDPFGNRIELMEKTRAGGVEDRS
jgi:catechol 2,3-dioxygenase-like lactoylglutathione lyase family enzyme